MICQACKDRQHYQCRYPSSCPCQHRAPARTTMSPEEYATVLSELTQMAQGDGLGDHGPDL